jgi:23S rRNA (guanosine2251-2'-O)-methyltransferase
MGDLLYGVHPLCEALKAGRRKIKGLYVSKSRTTGGVGALLGLANAKGIPVQYKDVNYFKARLGNAVHQGVAAHVDALPLADEKAILNKAERENERPLVLALDGVVDPQNLGSLVRTALAMGVHGIIIPKARAAPLSPTVSKASAGAMEHTLFARVSNLVSALKRMKKSGLWVAGACAASGQPVNEAALDVGLVLVIGGEGKGIRPLVRSTCDYLVSVPQKTVVNSLNAAVAGAMVMYEIMRQRQGK